MGDVKLALLLGAGLGRYVMVGLMIGMLAALLPAVVLLARHGSKARTMAIPFGPFLAFGAIVAFFFGQELLDAYLSRVLLTGPPCAPSRRKSTPPFRDSARNADTPYRWSSTIFIRFGG